MIELIALLVLFFAFLLGLPMLITLIKARSKAADISFKEAWGLTQRRTGRTELFKALSIAQKHNLKVSLTQLETHMLAGGNPAKVVDALVANKNKPELSFQTLSTLDFMGIDINECLSKGSEEHYILIKDLKFRDFKIDYQAKYKYGLSIAFVGEERSDLKQQIENKLQEMSLNWPSTDPIQTQNFLRQSVLNNEYWEKVLRANLIDQHLQIKI